MLNPFDYFEEIYCINLDHRTDRWAHAQEEFSKVGILDRVKRFSAIRHDVGVIGLTKSNLVIITDAKKRKLENVLIFEDDVHFILDNTLEILSLSIEQINRLKIKWQLFYLGANTHTKLTKISPNLIALNNGFATHSVAFHNSVYNKFIDYAENLKQIKKHSDIFDVWLSTEIQANQVALMTNPLLATQYPSYSDLEKTVVDYYYIEERFKNNIK